MYLLDISFLIDLVRGKPGAVELAKRIEEERAYVAISVVTFHEYLLGVYLSYKDENKRKEMLVRAELELSRFDVLPFTADIARRTAGIMASLIKEGEPLGLGDVIIATTAIERRLSLITRNVKHFSKIPALEIQSY